MVQNQATAPQAPTGLPAPNVSRAANSVDPAYIYKGLKARGLNDGQVFATMGEWKQESEFHPKALNPGEQAMGFNQWREGRRRGLENFARATGRDAANPDTQMDYFVRETGFTPDTTGTVHVDPGGPAFARAKDVREANAALKSFTRYGSPPDQGGQLTRLSNAFAYQKQYGGPGGDLIPGEVLHVGSSRTGGGSARSRQFAADNNLGQGVNFTVPLATGMAMMLPGYSPTGMGIEGDQNTALNTTRGRSGGARGGGGSVGTGKAASPGGGGGARKNSVTATLHPAKSTSHLRSMAPAATLQSLAEMGAAVSHDTEAPTVDPKRKV